MTSDEEILAKQLRKAGEARQVLNAEIFQEAKAAIENQLATLRRTVPIQETAMHTRIILMEQLWMNLLGFWEQLAQTGRMAELDLQGRERRRSFLEQGIALFRTQGRNSL